MTIDINELRRLLNSTDMIDGIDLHANIKTLLSEILDRLEAAEKERDDLRAKIHQYEMRLRKILEAPEDTMSNSKALAEIIRQARLALGMKK